MIVSTFYCNKLLVIGLLVGVNCVWHFDLTIGTCKSLFFAQNNQSEDTTGTKLAGRNCETVSNIIRYFSIK
jgi:hypothetical protein